MKILFIGVYADQKMINNLNALSQPQSKLSVAAIKYTRLIGEGFEKNIGTDCSKLFLVPVGMYPQCRLYLWGYKKNKTESYIPFINLLIIKQITIALFVFFYTFCWYLKQSRKEEKIVVFSSLYLPFLISVSPLKLLNNFKIISFVPDLPEYEFTYSIENNRIKQMLIPLYVKFSKKIININDFFVFITEKMREKFLLRPNVIIEGFTDFNDYSDKPNNIIGNKNAIMYAGGLYEKFGIKMLIDAFMDIKGDYELWFFGMGEMEEQINSSILIDSRIKYFGNRPNIEIIEFEKMAKILVNPRPSDNEFTKYSFPSKLMEYMVSGTPVLTTKLSGIPDDYIDKMYYIELETVNGIKDSILKCLSKSQEELDLFGIKTKIYVLKEKNNVIQINKLLKIIDKQFQINIK